MKEIKLTDNITVSIESSIESKCITDLINGTCKSAMINDLEIHCTSISDDNRYLHCSSIVYVDSDNNIVEENDVLLDIRDIMSQITRLDLEDHVAANCTTLTTDDRSDNVITTVYVEDKSLHCVSFCREELPYFNKTNIKINFTEIPDNVEVLGFDEDAMFQVSIISNQQEIRLCIDPANSLKSFVL